MNETEFLIWLKGFRECVGEGNAPNPEQWATMNAKLNEVITKKVRDLLLEEEEKKYWRDFKKMQGSVGTATWTSPTMVSTTGTINPIVSIK